MFGVSNVGVIPTKVPATASAGQVLFNTSGTTNWNVPNGVTSICCVCVQANGNAAATAVTVASTVVCQALNGSRIGDGGGDGGTAGTSYLNTTWFGGGGGGAGGYSGNGGNGSNASSSPTEATAGSGGGGGGGGRGRASGGSPGGVGGGVGLNGVGANGTAGTSFFGGHGGPGGPGSSGVGRKYGGGDVSLVAPYTAYRGGALSYKNNISVTPGSTVVISIGASNGAVRIIWGTGRAYPSTNTGNV